MKTHYDLLGIDPGAPAEEIKRAFRREIARYHPDKVQHLGQEFQEMAADLAAQLTEAYRTLMDVELRARYDESLASSGAAPLPSAPSEPDARREAPASGAGVEAEAGGQPATPTVGSGQFAFERATRDEYVKKATILRFRQALVAEFGSFQESSITGFDIACLSKSKLFGLGRATPRVLGRFVPQVDRPAVLEAWMLASKAGAAPDVETCVFLLGGELAPARELADAIAEQRRRPTRTSGGRLVLIPVDVRDWKAHVPTDAPQAARALLDRLRRAS